jgi:hypothetical protein
MQTTGKLLSAIRDMLPGGAYQLQHFRRPANAAKKRRTEPQRKPENKCV